MNRTEKSAHRDTVHRIANCLRRRFSIASFVLRSGCGLPVTATGVPLQTPHWPTRICINRSSLSADKGPCQAHFLFTTFCVAMPLAKIARRCFMQQLCNAIRTIESMEVRVAVHYHARFRERSMKEDRSREDVSRKGAKPQREEKKINHEEHEGPQRRGKNDRRFLLSHCAICVSVVIPFAPKPPLCVSSPEFRVRSL